MTPDPTPVGQVPPRRTPRTSAAAVGATPTKGARNSFDRVRPRAAAQATTKPAAAARPVDQEGKRALFSSAPPRPPIGGVEITCGGCGVASTLGPVDAVRTLVPSFHLPLLRRNRSYVHCPACGRWEWSHLTIKL